MLPEILPVARGVEVESGEVLAKTEIEEALDTLLIIAAADEVTTTGR